MSNGQFDFNEPCLVCGAESKPIPQCLELIFGEWFDDICCEQSLDFLGGVPQYLAGDSVEIMVKKELRYMVN